MSNKNTVQLADPNKKRASSMIEPPSGILISAQIKKANLDQKKANGDYQNLIKQKAQQGFSEEQRFISKDFGCLDKVLKIYQKVLATKQDAYLSRKRKEQQYLKSNDLLASENEQIKKRIEQLKTQQSRFRSMINAIRQEKQMKQPQNRPDFSEGSESMAESNLIQKITEVSKLKHYSSFDYSGQEAGMNMMFKKRWTSKQGENELLNIEHIEILQTFRSQKEVSEHQKKVTQSSQRGKIHSSSNKASFSDKNISENDLRNQNNLHQIKGNLISKVSSDDNYKFISMPGLLKSKIQSQTDDPEKPFGAKQKYSKNETPSAGVGQRRGRALSQANNFMSLAQDMKKTNEILQNFLHSKNYKKK